MKKAALLVALASFAIWGILSHRTTRADDDDDQKPIQSPSRVTRTAAGTLLTLDAETVERAGVKAETLAAVSMAPQTVAYGRLEEDPSRGFVVRAPVAGRIVAAGQWPAVGQTLADGTAIGSVEPRLAPMDRVSLSDRLSAARADAQSARAARTAARSSFERLRLLNADNKNVSDRAVQEAEARAQAEEARLASAEQSVRLLETALGAGAPGAASMVAERGGQVVEVLAQPGESLESGQPVLRLARFDRLIARVDLPAGQNLEAPPTARIVLLGRDDHPLIAERIAAAPAVDPKTQGRSFLFRVRDPGLGLRPGLALTAWLAAEGAARTGVTVPRSSVLHQSGKTWVYVETAAGKFARREVALGDATAEGWFTASLAPGTRVVSTGAQTLLSEEFKSQIQVGEEQPI